MARDMTLELAKRELNSMARSRKGWVRGNGKCEMSDTAYLALTFVLATLEAPTDAGTGLKPCFRCGNEAHLGASDGLQPNEWHLRWVECMAAECQVEGKSFTTDEEAIDWWNRRK